MSGLSYHFEICACFFVVARGVPFSPFFPRKVGLREKKMTRRQPDDKQTVSENVFILATVDVILKSRKSTACGCPAPEIVRRQVRAKILFQKESEI